MSVKSDVRSGSTLLLKLKALPTSLIENRSKCLSACMPTTFETAVSDRESVPEESRTNPPFAIFHEGWMSAVYFKRPESLQLSFP
jgi:hypothetical protein